MMEKKAFDVDEDHETDLGFAFHSVTKYLACDRVRDLFTT